PRSTPPSQRQYCSGRGRSSPYWARICWIVSGLVRCPPTRISAGSPGARCTSPKTTIEANRRTGITASRRRRTNAPKTPGPPYPAWGGFDAGSLPRRWGDQATPSVSLEITDPGIPVPERRQLVTAEVFLEGGDLIGVIHDDHRDVVGHQLLHLQQEFQ